MSRSIDKLAALKLLAQHYGPLTERIDVNLTGELSDLIHEGRERAIAARISAG